jgi:ATP-dependent Lon protease
MEFDSLDRLAAEAFEGYIVRKDLALRFKGQYPVPTYVGEFLLGRYCATTNEAEIAEGLTIVEGLMRSRTVRPDEQELFKSKAREMGQVKVIDLITARLDPKTDSYIANLPNVGIKDARIDSTIVGAHQRMLTGGFYAEIDLEYDGLIAEQKNGRPFGVAGLRPIQMSTKNALESLGQGRSRFSTDEWKNPRSSPTVSATRCC